MKKLSITLIILLNVFLYACEKDKENVLLSSEVSPNSLSNLNGSAFVLVMDNASSNFGEFQWTTPEYGFDAVVTYTLQFDKKGNAFANPVDLIIVTHNTKASVTVGDLNKLLLAANLIPDEAADIEFRVKSTIHSAVTPVFSNVIEAKITPYAVFFPPIYMTGAATGGWNWDLYVYKELRSPAPNIYETIGHFVSGEAFRFFKQANWGPTSWNYPYFTTVSPLFENANDGDLNFKFIGETGYYRVNVNMTTKTVTMEAVAAPVLYMTGAALGGWDWSGNFVQLTWKANGIFEATTEFANETFRFFKQAGWGDSYNYPWFTAEDGTVSELFENANDGDSNFRFIGTPGVYKITVNLIDRIVTMEAQ
jgi:starch-binding outer membrane protein SusE/F